MADLPISGLPAAGSLDGNELLLINQAGTDASLDLDTLAEYATGWLRPDDWPTMPADFSNQVAILAAVFDSTANYVALHAQTSAGTWDVDWGDGTSDTGIASNTQVNHQYTFSDPDLGPLTSRGYKTAMIVITPSSGNLTSIDLGRKNNTAGLQDASQPWLDIQINASSANTVVLRNAMVPRICERVAITNMGSTASPSFQGFRSLQSVSFPPNTLQGTGALTGMFQDCPSIRFIRFPSGSLANTTGLANAFRDAVSLQAIEFPAGALAANTSLESTFNGCQSLASISFPSGANGAVTRIDQSFTNCRCLGEVVFDDLGALTTMSGTFAGCETLTKITFPTGSMASGTMTTAANCFNDCRMLREIVNCEIPVSFTLTNCMLDSANLDQIYTSLPTIVGQTITVTGNIGTTGDDPTIATAKGWTVTGS